MRRLSRLCAPGPALTDDSVPQADDGALLAALDRHGIGAVIHALRSGARPALAGDLRRRLRDIAIETAALELQRRPALIELIEAMHAAQIPVLLMKGAALAYSLYPSPGQRPRSDTDILIPESAIAQTRTLLEGLGYQVTAPQAASTLSFQFDATRMVEGGAPEVVDIHFRLSNRLAFAEGFSFAELNLRSQPLEALCPAARGLGPSDALLLACFHRVGHLIEGAEDRLIWLYDIHLLVESLGEAETDRFVRLARDKGLVAICKDGIEMARACFGTRIPAALQSAIDHPPGREAAAALLHAGPLSGLWQQMKAQSGLAARLRLLRELLFPPRDYMRRRYPASRAGLAVLYARRGFEGVKRRLTGGR